MVGRMRYVTILMGLLLLTGLVLQYNDPDPLAWMAIYGAGTLVSVQALRVRLSWWQPVLVAVVAFGWAATLASSLEWETLASMFDEFEMRSVAVEEAREAVGLVIIGTWMAALAWTRRRAS